MLESIILILTFYWFLSFFPQAIAPGRTQTQARYLTDVLSVVIVVLIAIRFLF